MEDPNDLYALSSFFLFLSLDVLTTYLVYSIITKFYVCFSTFFFE